MKTKDPRLEYLLNILGEDQGKLQKARSLLRSLGRSSFRSVITEPPIFSMVRGSREVMIRCVSLFFLEDLCSEYMEFCLGILPPVR